MIATLSTIVLQTRAAPDTMVMVMARDGLQTAAGWAAVVVGLFFLILLPLLLLLLVQLRKLDRTVRQLGEKGLRRVDPLVEGGKNIADNVEFVTMAVRTDIEHLHGSVRSLSERLQQASDRMEERIEEFNALMEVVQSEAEDIFVGTAATVRGVRAGARQLGEGVDASGMERHPRRGEEPEGVVSTPGPAERSAARAARDGE